MFSLGLKVGGALSFVLSICNEIHLWNFPPTLLPLLLFPYCSYPFDGSVAVMLMYCEKLHLLACNLLRWSESCPAPPQLWYLWDYRLRLGHPHQFTWRLFELILIYEAPNWVWVTVVSYWISSLRSGRANCSRQTFPAACVWSLQELIYFSWEHAATGCPGATSKPFVSVSVRRARRYHLSNSYCQPN